MVLTEDRLSVGVAGLVVSVCLEIFERVSCANDAKCLLVYDDHDLKKVVGSSCSGMCHEQ